MNRRSLLTTLAAATVLPTAVTVSSAMQPVARRERARPGSAKWPTRAQWNELSVEVGGRLKRIEPPFADCRAANSCSDLLKTLRNPYYINATPNLTQVSGWTDAWRSEPSVYAVVATSAEDVAAAIKFANRHDLRIVVRGGAHSYQGTSNAADSLMIWTRAMDEIAVNDGGMVVCGAGCIWWRVYNEVTTKHSRYVQGGGCATVGVAGLISSGGFGSFSKRYGSAAGSLVEAEVVTADGRILTANSVENTDLFWALKGGGGGTFGVITKLTLKTHALPQFFGVAQCSIKASSESAYRRLVDRFMVLYAEQLHNEHWGEQVQFTRHNQLNVSMECAGLTQTEIGDIWNPFFGWVADAPNDYTMPAKPLLAAVPAERYWDANFLAANAPEAIVADRRAGARPGDAWWSGDSEQVGAFICNYRSLWMPKALLDPKNRRRLVDAILAASRKWSFSFHFNKGLNGAPDDAIARSRDTAMNPAVLDAFALMITASMLESAYPGFPAHEPDLRDARDQAAAIQACYAALHAIAPAGGAYVSEASYFDEDWQQKYWGEHYARLAEIKTKYDPNSLFIVHHGVGSEAWSRDGFTFIGSAVRSVAPPH
jgi:FAD/FMN-containing dehydrogenase